MPVTPWPLIMQPPVMDIMSSLDASITWNWQLKENKINLFYHSGIGVRKSGKYSQDTEMLVVCIYYTPVGLHRLAYVLMLFTCDFTKHHVSSVYIHRSQDWQGYNRCITWNSHPMENRWITWNWQFIENKFILL